MNGNNSTRHMDSSLLFSSEDDREWADALEGSVFLDSTNTFLRETSHSCMKHSTYWDYLKSEKGLVEDHLSTRSFKKRKSCSPQVDISKNASVLICKGDSSTKENSHQINDKTSKRQQGSADTNHHLAAMEGSWKRNGELLQNLQENIKDINAKITQRLTLIKQQYCEQRIRHKSTDQSSQPHLSRQPDRKKPHLLTHLHRKPTHKTDCPKQQFMKYIPIRQLLTHGNDILTNQKIIHCKLMMQLQFQRKSLHG